MAENVMSFANENAPRGLPIYHKSDSSQSVKSPTKRSQAVVLNKNAEARTPLRNRTKPKQPYLKRGTGLQNRLVAAKHKRYVPKGGFIKGQVEEEESQPQRPNILAADTDTCAAQANRHKVLQPDDLPAEVLTRSMLATTNIYGAEQHTSSPTRHSLQGLGNAVSGYADHAHNGFDAAQFCASAGDIETEMDADTALIHFPDGAQHVQGKQAQHSPQQPFHSHLAANEAADLSQLPSNRQASQFLMQAPGSQADRHNLPDVPDWQMQQAAEVISCTAFLSYHIIPLCALKLPQHLQIIH